jgi:predicted metal-dependent hydrolase
MWPNHSNSQSGIQSQELTFRQWSVVVERKAFRRTLTISLKPNAPIRVRAPLRTPLAKIQEFLEQKEAWIEKHMQNFKELSEKFPKKQLVQSETFPFLGQTLSLRFVPTPLKQVFFSRHEKHLQLHLPEKIWNDVSDQELQSYFPKLQKFYQREAEKLIRERIHIWSNQMQLFPKALKFRNQKTRWGSCTSKGSIQINWRLIGAPLEVIDYILIHELAHLKHMNHSKDFWQLVETHCPELSTHEKWLKENQAVLDFLIDGELS